MARITLFTGILLVLLGVGAYLVYLPTSHSSPTALIPAAFGLLLLGLGWLGRSERWRMHAMHAAALVAVLGLAGSARGLLSLPALLSGGEVARPGAVVAQSAMAVICLAFVVLAVQSFVAARLRRRSQAA